MASVFSVRLNIVDMSCVNSVVCNSYMFTFSWFLIALGLVVGWWQRGTALVFREFVCLFVCCLYVGWCFCWRLGLILLYVCGCLCLFGGML